MLCFYLVKITIICPTINTGVYLSLLSFKKHIFHNVRVYIFIPVFSVKTNKRLFIYCIIVDRQHTLLNQQCDNGGQMYFVLCKTGSQHLPASFRHFPCPHPLADHVFLLLPSCKLIPTVADSFFSGVKLAPQPPRESSNPSCSLSFFHLLHFSAVMKQSAPVAPSFKTHVRRLTRRQKLVIFQYLQV